MSSDNGILIDLKNLSVIYYMGEGKDKPIKCKDLEEAVVTAQKLDEDVGGTEYGISFINSLND